MPDYYNYFYESFAMEGGDTTGKSTITQMMKIALLEKAIPFEVSNYYNNPYGYAAMKLGLQETQQGKDFKFQLLLDSVEWNIKHVLIPAEKAGKLVVHDRSFFSTMVYQGVLENANVDDIYNEYKNLFSRYQLPIPTMMLVDVDIDVVMERLSAKRVKTDTYEQQDKEFHRKILQGYRDYLHYFKYSKMIYNDPFLTQEEINVIIAEYLS